MQRGVRPARGVMWQKQGAVGFLCSNISLDSVSIGGDWLVER